MESQDVHIRWRPVKDVDLSGATVIEAVPSSGLPAAIAAGYLVKSLNLDHVGGFESDAFPPVSMVWKGKPRAPLRVYAREDAGVAVIACEFTPKPHLFRPVARAILSWAEDAGVGLIVSPDGLASKGKSYDPDSPRVVAAASTDAVRVRLEDADVPFLERGMVSGVTGMLLTEARDARDVAALLVEVAPDPRRRVHDAHAAGVVLDALSRVLPDLGLDTRKLYDDATRAERMLRELRGTAARAASEDEIAAAYR